MEKNPTPEDIKVDKDKFDALLRKIAKTPALKPEEKKVGPIEGRIYRKPPGKKKNSAD
jgi:hypothetical protein